MAKIVRLAGEPPCNARFSERGGILEKVVQSKKLNVIALLCWPADELPVTVVRGANGDLDGKVHVRSMAWLADLKGPAGMHEE